MEMAPGEAAPWHLFVTGQDHREEEEEEEEWALAGLHKELEAAAPSSRSPGGLSMGGGVIHHQQQTKTQGRTSASLAEEPAQSPDVADPPQNGGHTVHTNTMATQRCQPPPHEYSSASLALKWGNTAYCMRLPLLGEENES